MRHRNVLPWLSATIPLVLVCFPWTTLAYDNSKTFELAEVRPSDEQKNVPVNVSINLRFDQPVAGKTLKYLTLHRLEKNQSQEVKVKRATDLTGASITLSPHSFLVPSSVYEIRGSAKVKSKNGKTLKPFRSRFTTGAAQPIKNEGLVFEPERFDTTRSMTTVLFGPDRRLYAADAFGNLVRWNIAKNGKPINKQMLLSDPKRSRQYIDLEWDPKADADNLILWVSYGERLVPKDDRYYFTGTIARLEIGETIKQRVVVMGLPHGREKMGGFDTLPHHPNGLAF